MHLNCRLSAEVIAEALYCAVPRFLIIGSCVLFWDIVTEEAKRHFS
jgi:hypothetical protein